MSFCRIYFFNFNCANKVAQHIPFVFLLQYEAVSVPYPADKKNLTKDIEADEKTAVSELDHNALAL